LSSSSSSTGGASTLRIQLTSPFTQKFSGGATPNLNTAPSYMSSLPPLPLASQFDSLPSLDNNDDLLSNLLPPLPSSSSAAASSSSLNSINNASTNGDWDLNQFLAD
jgi:hypothetical protein